MRRTPDGRPELVANSEREEILLRLFATYNEPATARRVDSYLEILEPYPTEALRDASKDWRSQPHKGAPDVGELKAMCERAGHRPPTLPDSATAPAFPPEVRAQQLDEFWAELVLRDHRPTIRQMAADHARRRLAGQIEPGASLEAVLKTFVQQLRRVPPARERRSDAP